MLLNFLDQGCLTSSQATVWKWFEDVVRGKRDHFGIHNTGNLVVTEVIFLSNIDIVDFPTYLTMRHRKSAELPSNASQILVDVTKAFTIDQLAFVKSYFEIIETEDDNYLLSIGLVTDIILIIMTMVSS